MDVDSNRRMEEHERDLADLKVMISVVLMPHVNGLVTEVGVRGPLSGVRMRLTCSGS